MLRPRALLPLAFVSLAALALAPGAEARPPATAKASPPSAGSGAPATKRPLRAHPKPKKPNRRAPKLAPGSRGSLAWAIARHAPKLHATVAEGALPPVLRGATCPSDMANVDDRICVDLYEGSLVEVNEGGLGAPWSAFATPEPGRTFRAMSVAGVVPQAYISGAQAAAACGLSGKRLCQPAEWRHACGGSAGAAYPYGATYSPGTCNDHGKSPMLLFYPQVVRGFDLVGAAEMNDPRLNQLPGTVMKTGELEGCVNDFGLHDMVGNLHEWTADPNGTFQGGYYLDTSQNGDGCTYRTAAHDFGYHDYSTGFRCCADPTVAEAGDE